MIPGIYGFHWDAGHLIFLGAFYTAVTLIFVTVARSWLRTRRDLRTGRAPAIRWRSDFHDLPERSRRCRHELTGEVRQRECPNAFDCRVCTEHFKFRSEPAGDCDHVEILGLQVPLDRVYHRGHTWLHAEPDGTVTIGLDPLAARLCGPDAQAELPAPGASLAVNTPAWTMRCGGETLRILSPVDGTVLSAEVTKDGVCLRVQPAPNAKTTHLLYGHEVGAWLNSEVERLELALSSTGVGAALADGGTMIEDPGKAYPADAWSAAREEILLG